MGGMLTDELGGHGLAVQPLLQIVEGLDDTITQDQKLAIGDAAKRSECCDDVGKAAEMSSPERENSRVSKPLALI